MEIAGVEVGKRLEPVVAGNKLGGVVVVGKRLGVVEGKRLGVEEEAGKKLVERDGVVVAGDTLENNDAVVGAVRVDVVLKEGVVNEGSEKPVAVEDPPKVGVVNEGAVKEGAEREVLKGLVAVEAAGAKEKDGVLAAVLGANDNEGVVDGALLKENEGVDAAAGANPVKEVVAVLAGAVVPPRVKVKLILYCGW